jgi:pyruvate formate lyase activating enzyme
MITFGGIQKNSFIDFPGKLSAVLFVSGCNFTCPYCHNPDLAKGKLPNPLTEGQAYAFLNTRQGFLEAVVLSGGEPTLCREISRICKHIKSLGYPLKLDTNGSRPDVLKTLLKDKIIDYVAMDIKTDPAAYGPPFAPIGSSTKVLKSIDLLMSGNVPYEFRTTCVTPFVSPAIMTHIGRRLTGANAYFLQPFRPQNVLLPDCCNTASTKTIIDLESLRKAVAAFVPACKVRS